MTTPWTDITLDAAGQWLSGGTPSKQSSALWKGTMPWVSPKDMKRPRIADAIDHVAEAAVGNGTQLAPVGSLLMVVRGMILAHTFPVAVTTGPVTFNQDIKALVPGAGWSSEFLLHWLQFMAPEVLRLVDVANHGTKRLPSERLFALSLPQPPPWEQKKIATILSSVDEAIEATQAVIDHLQVVKKAMMAELLTRGLPGRHTRFKQTEIGHVPEAWDVVPFERLLAEGDSLSYGILQPGDHDPSGIPMLRTVDLDEHGGRSNTVILRVNRGIEAQYERTRLRGGEVLLSVMGTVGRTVVVPPEWIGWNVNRALAVVRVNGGVTAEYLGFWLRSPATQDRFAVEQIGSAQKRINLGDLRKMVVPAPGVEEQTKLCEVLSAYEQRHACEAGCLAQLRTAKAALMSALLTGEVRVKPDEDAA
jgi:type I restriction enzyme, S subunit